MFFKIILIIILLWTGWLFFHGVVSRIIIKIKKEKKKRQDYNMLKQVLRQIPDKFCAIVGSPDVDNSEKVKYILLNPVISRENESLFVNNYLKIYVQIETVLTIEKIRLPIFKVTVENKIPLHSNIEISGIEIIKTWNKLKKILSVWENKTKNEKKIYNNLVLDSSDEFFQVIQEIRQIVDYRSEVFQDLISVKVYKLLGILKQNKKFQSIKQNSKYGNIIKKVQSYSYAVASEKADWSMSSFRDSYDGGIEFDKEDKNSELEDYNKDGEYRWDEEY